MVATSNGVYEPASHRPLPQTGAALLITGGCGFIGTNFLDCMLKKGAAFLRILDNLSVGQIESLESVLSGHGGFEEKALVDENVYLYRPNQPTPPSGHSDASRPHCRSQVALMVGDIRNPDDCIRATEGVSAVVHLAAQSGVPSSVNNPTADCEINVLGTVNMLEACRANGVDKFIFASSGAPLGEVEPPIHENKLPHPISPYGASKLSGEAYCAAFSKTYGIKTVILRFGNVYGLRSNHKTSVVAKFLKRALAGLPLEIYGDGYQTRDFIYTEDLCGALYMSLQALGLHLNRRSPHQVPDVDAGPTPARKEICSEIFQIATSRETTVAGIAERIKTIVESETGRPVDIVHSPRRIGDIRRNFSDITKARTMLGWEPRWSLGDGLEKTFEWMRENGRL